MNQDILINIFGEGIRNAIIVGGPVVAVALIGGVIMALFQALTQVNEQSLSFVPKLILSALVILLGSGWMVDTLLNYSLDLFNSIPEVVRSL